MGVVTAFTDNTGNTDLLIDWSPMNDVNDGSLIISMKLTVPGRMTDGTFFRFWKKISHKGIKKKFS